jgi:outer membrane immunogenic protein
MKKLMLATSAVIALVVVAPAGAADLPVKAASLRPVVPLCAQFGGFYVGGQVGWAYYDHTWSDRDAWSAIDDERMLRGSVHTSENGFIGGVQGGWNWQTNCTVFGIEVDYNWAGVEAEAFESDGETGESLDTLSVSSRLRGFGTLRTRTGLVVHNVLLYVTGGLAFANFERSHTLTSIDPPTVETFEHRHTRWGWTAGFGSEWAFAPNWSLKSEVLYARFEKEEQSFTCAQFCSEPQAFRFDHRDDVWTSRIGINYRFGGFGKGPVMAKY